MGTEPAVDEGFAAILGHRVPLIDILDIGAMLEDGGDRYDPLIVQDLARVTGFEPNPAELKRLSERPGPYRYLPLFLGDGGTATFHLTRYPGCARRPQNPRGGNNAARQQSRRSISSLNGTADQTAKE